MLCSFRLQLIFFSEEPFYGNYSTLNSHTNTVIFHAFAYKVYLHRYWPRERINSIREFSKDVYEQCTSTGNEAFSLLICLDAFKFVLLSSFTLIETICPKMWAKPLLKNGKRPLPVDVHRSFLLKLLCEIKALLLPIRHLFSVMLFRSG